MKSIDIKEIDNSQLFRAKIGSLNTEFMTTLIGSLRINTISSTIFHYPIKTSDMKSLKFLLAMIRVYDYEAESWEFESLLGD